MYFSSSPLWLLFLLQYCWLVDMNATYLVFSSLDMLWSFVHLFHLFPLFRRQVQYWHVLSSFAPFHLVVPALLPCNGEFLPHLSLAPKSSVLAEGPAWSIYFHFDNVIECDFLTIIVGKTLCTIMSIKTATVLKKFEDWCEIPLPFPTRNKGKNVRSMFTISRQIFLKVDMAPFNVGSILCLQWWILGSTVSCARVLCNLSKRDVKTASSDSSVILKSKLLWVLIKLQRTFCEARFPLLRLLLLNLS